MFSVFSALVLKMNVFIKKIRNNLVDLSLVSMKVAALTQKPLIKMKSKLELPFLNNTTL